MVTTATRLPAAAPAWVGAMVGGPDRPARVVHRGADAVYLEVDGWCLGVLSTAATAVPCALRTGLSTLPGPLLAAAEGRVGTGRLALGDTDVVVGRLVDTAVPRLGADRVTEAAERLRAVVGDRLDAARAELPGTALDDLAAGRPEAVPALLGRGSGLTPLGDDVLAGWLASAVATGSLTDRAAPVAASVAAEAHERTTLLSTTLLDCARRGDVLPEFRRLLLDLAAPTGSGVTSSVDALLRVGHTSGAGLLLGTVLYLRRLASRSHA